MAKSGEETADESIIKPGGRNKPEIIADYH